MYSYDYDCVLLKVFLDKCFMMEVKNTSRTNLFFSCNTSDKNKTFEDKPLISLDYGQ